VGERTEELRREIEATRDDLGDTLDAIGDRVSPGRVIERRKNKITGGTRSIVDRVMGKAHDMQSSVSSSGHDAAGAVQHIPDNIRSSAQGAPVMAGVIAFAAGFVLAAAIPPSEAEKHASSQLAPKLQPMKDEVIGAGREVGEHLKEPVADAVQDVKSSAKESVDSVKSSAKDAAQETTQQAKDSAQTVKDDARSAS